MATNISLTTFENCAVIYFDDGTTTVVDPHKEYFVQLGDMEFCSISEAKPIDESEHPDQSLPVPQPPPPPERIAAAWKAFWAALKEEVQDPVATPV